MRSAPENTGGQSEKPVSIQPAQFAEAIQAATAAVADQVGGGLALLFTAGGDTPGSAQEARLRFAAGFASPQTARKAANILMPQVVETLAARARTAAAGEPALGNPARGQIVMHPLMFGDRLHGVLAVACPEPLDPTRQTAVERLASTLTLHFDHAVLSQRVHQAQAQVDRAQQGFERKSEEILDLSEALFAQDIELLRNNERLGEIENLKNDFIERMSRELRTPLNGIIEAIIGVLTNEHESLAEGSRESLRHALDDGTGFLRTLQNILDLWRVKQHQLPVEVQEINFRDIVDEAIFSVQDAVSRKRLTIEQEIAEPLPKIRSDVAKLNQLVFLLLDNAVKFTPAGTVTVRAQVDGDRLHCEVRDTGIGIAPDDRDSVFDDFFQVESGTSPRYGGAGLGLTLVRELVMLLEGEVSLSSEIGKGTRVAFQVPVQVVG